MSSVIVIFENFLLKLIKHIFQKFFKKDLSEKFCDTISQIIKFGIVGITNTAISYFLYIVFLFLFVKLNIFTKFDYLIAQVISFLISVLWSFYWNRRFVFHSDENNSNWIISLIKTYISYSFTGLFINSLLTILFVQIFEISKIIAPLINLAITIPLNFVLNKFWANNTKKEK